MGIICIIIIVVLKFVLRKGAKPMNTPVLSLRDVTKNIKSRHIIKGLSFDVHRGQVYGFLGPNGAGKTMTLRMIVGLIKPTTGQIRICGYDIQGSFVKAMSHVGCIIENPEFYDYLTGYENLCHFFGMEKGLDRTRLEAVIDKVGMRHKINDLVSTYSLGMKQRLGIAQALMKNPTLLILDEPTNGLDPAGIKEFRHLIHSLAKEENMTIFVSSHLLSEIQMMCDEVTIILHGRTILTSSVSELLKNQKVTWRLSSPEKAQFLLKEKWSLDSDITEQDELVLYMAPQDIGDINRHFIENDINIQYVAQTQQSLEDLFMQLTGGETIG